ncbi:hypothetical protein ACQUSY_02340 [Microbacterium sp. YY-03]|uniref:hypothetical protein n=1 Tax=Microbacterium sp. YY-03 TaxID=3421636 RepID=UPI003D16398D
MTPRFKPVSVHGSVWGLLASYWFALAAVVIIVIAVGRTNPTAAMWVILVALIALLVSSAFATGSAVIVTERAITVRRRLRAEWSIPAADLTTIEEHIPMRPRARSLAGWAFRAEGHPKATIEMAMFAPLDRRKLRNVFADVLVSPDLGRPTANR